METPVKKDVVPSSYREKYAATGGTNGDFIAKKLQEISKDGDQALATVKRENDIPEGKWATQNVGMQRMNLSNVLRSSFLKGIPIVILGREYDIKGMLEETGLELNKDDDKSFDKFFDKIDVNANDRTRSTVKKTFFGPWPKTPEQRAEEKAERDRVKAEEKAEKAKKRAEEKAEKAKKRAEEKAERDRAAAEKKAEREAEKAEKKAAKEAKA